MQLRLIGLTLQSNLGLALRFVLVTAMHVIIMFTKVGRIKYHVISFLRHLGVIVLSISGLAMRVALY